MSRANEPAYPVTREELVAIFKDAPASTATVHHVGLTIREHFAAMAMQGILAATFPGMSRADLAVDAAKAADALIAELAKPIEAPLDENGFPVQP